MLGMPVYSNRPWVESHPKNLLTLLPGSCYGSHMNTTATATVLYRTAKGSHAHSSWTCANNLRAIESGEPLVIPAAEVTDWAACEFCCTATQVAAAAIAAEIKASAMCNNTAVAQPGRLRSTCTDCGKAGAVDRRTGKLRSHKA